MLKRYTQEQLEHLLEHPEQWLEEINATLGFVLVQMKNANLMPSKDLLMQHALCPLSIPFLIDNYALDKSDRITLSSFFDVARYSKTAEKKIVQEPMSAKEQMEALQALDPLRSGSIVSIEHYIEHIEQWKAHISIHDNTTKILAHSAKTWSSEQIQSLPMEVFLKNPSIFEQISDNALKKSPYKAFWKAYIDQQMANGEDLHVADVRLLDMTDPQSKPALLSYLHQKDKSFSNASYQDVLNLGATNLMPLEEFLETFSCQNLQGLSLSQVQSHKDLIAKRLLSQCLGPSLRQKLIENNKEYIISKAAPIDPFDQEKSHYPFYAGEKYLPIWGGSVPMDDIQDLARLHMPQDLFEEILDTHFFQQILPRSLSLYASTSRDDVDYLKRFLHIKTQYLHLFANDPNTFLKYTLFEKVLDLFDTPKDLRQMPDEAAQRYIEALQGASRALLRFADQTIYPYEATALPVGSLSLDPKSTQPTPATSLASDQSKEHRNVSNQSLDPNLTLTLKDPNELPFGFINFIHHFRSHALSNPYAAEALINHVIETPTFNGLYLFLQQYHAVNQRSYHKDQEERIFEQSINQALPLVCAKFSKEQCSKAFSLFDLPIPEGLTFCSEKNAPQESSSNNIFMFNLLDLMQEYPHSKKQEKIPEKTQTVILQFLLKQDRSFWSRLEKLSLLDPKSPLRLPTSFLYTLMHEPKAAAFYQSYCLLRQNELLQDQKWCAQQLASSNWGHLVPTDEGAQVQSLDQSIARWKQLELKKQQLKNPEDRALLLFSYFEQKEQSSWHSKPQAPHNWHQQQDAFTKKVLQIITPTQEHLSKAAHQQILNLPEAKSLAPKVHAWQEEQAAVKKSIETLEKTISEYPNKVAARLMEQYIAQKDYLSAIYLTQKQSETKALLAQHLNAMSPTSLIQLLETQPHVRAYYLQSVNYDGKTDLCIKDLNATQYARTLCTLLADHFTFGTLYPKGDLLDAYPSLLQTEDVQKIQALGEQPKDPICNTLLSSKSADWQKAACLFPGTPEACEALQNVLFYAFPQDIVYNYQARLHLRDTQPSHATVSTPWSASALCALFTRLDSNGSFLDNQDANARVHEWLSNHLVQSTQTFLDFLDYAQEHPKLYALCCDHNLIRNFVHWDPNDPKAACCPDEAIGQFVQKHMDFDVLTEGVQQWLCSANHASGQYHPQHPHFDPKISSSWSGKNVNEKLLNSIVQNVIWCTYFDRSAPNGNTLYFPLCTQEQTQKLSEVLMQHAPALTQEIHALGTYTNFPEQFSKVLTQRKDPDLVNAILHPQGVEGFSNGSLEGRYGTYFAHYLTALSVHSLDHKDPLPLLYIEHLLETKTFLEQHLSDYSVNALFSNRIEYVEQSSGTIAMFQSAKEALELSELIAPTPTLRTENLQKMRRL